MLSLTYIRLRLDDTISLLQPEFAPLTRISKDFYCNLDATDNTDHLDMPPYGFLVHLKKKNPLILFSKIWEGVCRAGLRIWFCVSCIAYIHS